VVVGPFAMLEERQLLILGGLGVNMESSSWSEMLAIVWNIFDSILVVMLNWESHTFEITQKL